MLERSLVGLCRGWKKKKNKPRLGLPPLGGGLRIRVFIDHVWRAGHAPWLTEEATGRTAQTSLRSARNDLTETQTESPFLVPPPPPKGEDVGREGLNEPD